jgi:flagellar biosynthesis regulator FlbT
MSLRAEGEAIYINCSIIRDCFVAALLAMTGGVIRNDKWIQPNANKTPLAPAIA